jgi:hypothetical protein
MDRVDEVFAFVCEHAEFTESILWEGGASEDDWDEEEFSERRERTALAAVFGHIWECHVELLRRCRAALREKDKRSRVFAPYNAQDATIWDKSGVSLDLTGGAGEWRAWLWVNIEENEQLAPGTHRLWVSVHAHRDYRHLLRDLHEGGKSRAGDGWVGIPEGLELTEGKQFDDLTAALVGWAWPMAKRVSRRLARAKKG